MEGTTTIDKAGRVVIPKQVRDELRLAPGDTLVFASEGESVTLRPLHTSAPLQKERGVWVFRGRKTLSLDEANQIVRDAREQRDGRDLDERQR
jgi:AbrB family looped-hinge helix DNA binding protein